MMRPRVLVVTQTEGLSARVDAIVGPRGYLVASATLFATGKDALARSPHLLITEIRLGDYNGLHLAMRASVAGIPAIVFGPPDSVLIRDAREMGATYLGFEVDNLEIADTIARLLEPSQRATGSGALEWVTEDPHPRSRTTVPPLRH